MASKIKMSKQEREWQAEDAMRTLQRAEAIKKDSRLMADVRKAAANLTKVVGVTKRKK